MTTLSTIIQATWTQKPYRWEAEGVILGDGEYGDVVELVGSELRCR